MQLQEGITDRKSWCYDIETLNSCWTYTARNIDTLELVQYVLHEDRWDWDDLIDHLLSIRAQIGFNNVNFDYPVLHFILKNRFKWGHI
jgi:hypothetical protein